MAENEGWDKAIQAIELQHLLTIESTFDVTVTRFEVPDIDLILQDSIVEPDSDVVVESVQGPAVTQLGDLWRLGKRS